jgi:hypothetical protein
MAGAIIIVTVFVAFIIFAAMSASGLLKRHESCNAPKVQNLTNGPVADINKPGNGETRQRDLSCALKALRKLGRLSEKAKRTIYFTEKTRSQGELMMLHYSYSFYEKERVRRIRRKWLQKRRRRI